MDLKMPGFENVGQIYRNVSTPALYEQIVQRRERELAHLEPVAARTGQHTATST
jgi:phosphoenolpyruvate carboxykinase (ATP)